jgi:hypothetical protein
MRPDNHICLVRSGGVQCLAISGAVSAVSITDLTIENGFTSEVDGLVSRRVWTVVGALNYLKLDNLELVGTIRCSDTHHGRGHCDSCKVPYHK